MSTLAQQRLKADATNRGQRTFVQGFYIDLVVAAALFVLLNLDGLDVTSAEAVLTFCVAFGKTVLTSMASYVVRMYGDKSKLPTGPLPPEDPGPPAEEVAPSPPITAVQANDEAERHLTPAEVAAMAEMEVEEPLDADHDDLSPAEQAAFLDPTLLSHGPQTVKAVSQRTKKAPVKKAAPRKAPAKKAAPRKKTQ